MNTKLLLVVADWIEQHPEGYSQSRWVDAVKEGGYGGARPPAQTIATVGMDCGTTSCVAGWAVRLSGEAFDFSGFTESWDWHDAGRDVLGLADHQADWLFDGGQDEATMPATLRAIAAGERPWEA